MVTNNTSCFISHQSSDRELAQALCEALESRGIRCWIAPRDVIPGRPYAEECWRGIDESESLILLASQAAIQSVQVLSEVEQAHRRSRPIYTVMIGKPRVSRELDFYISRMHWIEFAGTSVVDLGNRLADVLSGKQNWDTVASGPSLRRLVLYRRDAFVGSLAGTLVIVALVGLVLLGGGFYLKKRLSHSYLNLGKVASLIGHSSRSGPDSMDIQAQVWLLEDDARFGDASLDIGLWKSDRPPQQLTFNSWPTPDQVGSEQTIDLHAPFLPDRLTTCLIVGAQSGKAKYRVTQFFSVKAAGEGRSDFDINPISEPQVREQDGSACGAVP